MPEELLTQDMKAWYADLPSKAWHEDPFGFYVYKTIDNDGDQFIVPGINLKGRSPEVTFVDSTPLVNKAAIESLVELFFESEREWRRQGVEDVNFLLHDLRKMSSMLYHALEHSRRDVELIGRSSEKVQSADLMAKINGALSTQHLLKLRIDAADYDLNESESVVRSGPIDVSRVVHEVMVAFEPYAQQKKLSINMPSPQPVLITGPNILEVIPYILLENATKYARPGTEIDVSIDTDKNDVILSVTSSGPYIADDERERIFDRHFRAKNAVLSGRPGSGLGLAILTRIVQRYFFGKVSIHQESPIDGMLMECKTTFVVALPGITIDDYSFDEEWYLP